VRIGTAAEELLRKKIVEKSTDGWTREKDPWMQRNGIAD
jgi:hypothetical protein